MVISRAKDFNQIDQIFSQNKQDNQVGQFEKPCIYCIEN
jgi:hypothetical protein